MYPEAIGTDSFFSTPESVWTLAHASLKTLNSYRIISQVYKGKIAKRSNLPYINHIHEGVYVLTRLFGWDSTLASAYCLHPLFQSDRSLESVVSGDVGLEKVDPISIILAMEYRRIANGYISTNSIRQPEDIELSPLHSVNRLLVADKIQNKKDFMMHMFDSVDRPSYRRASKRYVAYFDGWLNRLSVSLEVYSILEQELIDMSSLPIA